MPTRQKSEMSEEKVVVPKGGAGAMALVFEAGATIQGQLLTRTFQPSYVVTRTGAVLAFCQGRFGNKNDDVLKVIMINRSTDGGATWGIPERLSSPINHYALAAYSAPRGEGERISLLTCICLKVTKEFYDNDAALLKEKTGIDLRSIGAVAPAVLCRYYSDDDGHTWRHEYLTGANSPLLKNYDGYTPVFINTIGQVHKITEGPYAGRFILACHILSAPDGQKISDHFRNHDHTGSGVIYSDDQGENWQMDGMITDYLGNECSAVSIKQGREVLMIRRSHCPDMLKQHPPATPLTVPAGHRIAHTSRDGGASWSEPFLLKISDVLCHGVLARSGTRLYFSMPNGPVGTVPEGPWWDVYRVQGAIYYSDDEGINWQHKVIEEGLFSYSTVGRLDEESMIVFYARGPLGEEGIACRIFTDSWLNK